MTTTTTTLTDQTELNKNPGYQAFWALRIGFTAVPLLMGIDKFANVMTNDWTKYLANPFNDIIPGNAADAMHIIGVVEIIAAVVVLLLPRLGAPVVALWLAGIIINLLIVRGYGDVALRDFGLMLCAIVLARLAFAFPKSQFLGLLK